MTDEYDRQPVGEGGEPGEGVGRREEVEPSGVYPASGDVPEQAMPLRHAGEWGEGGDAGPEGYEESGSSELTPPDRTGDEAS